MIREPIGEIGLIFYPFVGAKKREFYNKIPSWQKEVREIIKSELIPALKKKKFVTPKELGWGTGYFAAVFYAQGIYFNPKYQENKERMIFYFCHELAHLNVKDRIDGRGRFSHHQEFVDKLIEILLSLGLNLETVSQYEYFKNVKKVLLREAKLR